MFDVLDALYICLFVVKVVTTFELPGVNDMFTVCGQELGPGGMDATGQPLDSYLLLSRPDSTMVLQTGQEINEMDESGFDTTNRTILAANLGNNRFVVQVCPNDVRLLDAVSAALLYQLTVKMKVEEGEEEFVVRSASVLDPYVALLSQDGRIQLLRLELKAQTCSLVFAPSPPVKVITLIKYNQPKSIK